MFHFLIICIENWQKLLICSKNIFPQFSQKYRIFFFFQILKNWFKKMFERNLYGKIVCKKVKILQKLKIRRFLSITFLRNIFSIPFQRIWNPHKILHFRYPFGFGIKKIWGVILAHFCKFGMHTLKKLYIFRHIA